MAIAEQGIKDREYAKFIDCNNETAVRTKICQEPGEALKVDIVEDGDIIVYGADSDGTKVQLRLSQEGAVNSNGDYDGTVNKKPSSQGQILHDRAATAASPTETSQNLRPTAVEHDDGSTTRVCADMALHDESGAPYSQANPLPISISESFDAIDFTYPDQKTEIFKYYSGGIGGNLVATVTVTYYDTGKRKIKSVSKV